MITIDRSKKFSQFFEQKIEPRKIDFLVLHHIEANSCEHAIDQLCEHQVSSHFLVDESGKIFELVDENNIAWHAGTSFWRGFESLNQNSIGIEFINSSPFGKKFEEAQMRAGIELCRYLIEKYKIEARNVVGHSDIAYNKQTSFLNRKQDPSHFFDWKFFAENGVGIFPKKNATKEKIPLLEIKKMLQDFGYRVINLNDEFDEEMRALSLVFNRRFLGKESSFWEDESTQALLSISVDF